MIGLSIAFMAVFLALHLSAALLIGAMCGAIVMAALDGGVTVPRALFRGGQAIVGCMIARSMSREIIHTVTDQWPIFVAAIVSVIVAGVVIGILLTRWRVLPGTTALWGSFPGAATAMTIMSEEYGADQRLVAFMQYLRAAITALLASGVAWSFAGKTPTQGSPMAWLAPVDWLAFAATMGVTAVAAFAGRLLKVPAGALIGPMVVATLLQDFVGLKIELPPILLAFAYAAVGWGVGLRFDREILSHAAGALPRVFLSILALVAVCALFAVALVVFAGKDPMTAYLAMSPGGVDSVAIIAASSPNVDMPFVMAQQMIRFLVVLILGPGLARVIAKRVGGAAVDLDEKSASRG